jgi:hypothetical protein
MYGMKIFTASALLPVHAKHVQTLRIDHRSSNSIGSMIPHLLGSFGMSVWASAPKGRIGSDRIGSDRIGSERCPGGEDIGHAQNDEVHPPYACSGQMADQKATESGNPQHASVVSIHAFIELFFLQNSRIFCIAMIFF